MSDTRLLQPSAASILQSMRDIGYTLDTAVADIIDNSIAASADKIELIFLENPTPHFLVIDNGSGYMMKNYMMPSGSLPKSYCC